MYIFISDDCLQDAKTYHIEEKLQELAGWVEESDYQQFSSMFEMFEYPYYVRKGLAHRYRLLVKLTDVMVDGIKYPVVVFFKIFHRGRKDYETLYIKAEENGDNFYQQQNLDNIVSEFVTTKVKNNDLNLPIEQHTEECYSCLHHAKTNYLQLSRLVTDDYYCEDISWWAGVRPHLTDSQLKDTFHSIQTAFEQHKNHQLSINRHQIHFEVEPNYLLTADESSQDKVFSRYLPTDVLLDKTLWLDTQKFDLPIYLNDFQDKVVQEIFYQTDSFPLFINAPSHAGKTSILAILSAHFLLQPNNNYQHHLPCLFLCEPQETAFLQQQIFYYIQFQQKFGQLPLNTITENEQQLKQKIELSCTDILTFILRYLDDEGKQRFQPDFFIDKKQFISLLKKQPAIKNGQLANYSIDLYWFIVQYVIKGEQYLLGDGKVFQDTLDEYSALSRESFDIIYRVIWKEWYEPLTENNYWDLQDIVAYIQTKKTLHFPKYTALLVDDAEQYSKLTYQFILQQCYWHQQPHLLSQVPLIFAGYDKGAVPAQLYCWYDELHQLFYRLFDGKRELSSLHVNQQNFNNNYINIINYYLQYQRHKTNVIKLTNTLDGNDLSTLPCPQIYFISHQQTDVLQALIANEQIAIILKTAHDNRLTYLKHSSPLQHLFKYANVSQINLPCFGINNIPQKFYSIALIGFYHTDLIKFKQEKTDFAFLTFEERYILDEKINTIRYAIQHGLRQIFIIGDNNELPIWQQLLQINDYPNIISQATLDTINPNYLIEQQDLFNRYQQALENQDTSAIFEIALHYYQYHHYENYFICLLKYYQIKNSLEDYQDFFSLIEIESQKTLTMQQLWQQQQAQIMLHFSAYFPKQLRGNLYALQIVYDNPLTIQWLQAFSLAIEQYLNQYQQPIWADYWQEILPLILTKLTEQTTLSIKNWQIIEKKLIELQEVYQVSPDILAFCAYQLKQPQTALQLWQTALQTQQIQELPDSYYQSLLETTDDWHEKIICSIQLKNLDMLMNLLTTHNLNELQLQYWDKILPYLAEEDELEPVLLDLLPHIHHQDILDRLYHFCENDTSENFAMRIQRFKTLQACFNNDWDTVIERLEHYVPIQDTDNMYNKLVLGFGQKQVSKFKNRTKITRPKMNYKVQEELVDILYALNLNENLHIITDSTALQQYAQQPHIVQIFDNIRKIFSIRHEEEGVWNFQFPAIRSLCYLLEKSYNPLDILELYGSILSQSNNSSLNEFTVERLMVMMQRFGQLNLEDNNDIEIDETKKIFIKQAIVLDAKYKKLFKNIKTPDNPYELPILKTKEELIKSVLALTNKENAEMQKQKQDEIKAQKALEAEQKQKDLEKQAEEKRLQQLEQSLLLAKQKKQEQTVPEEQVLEKDNDKLFIDTISVTQTISDNTSNNTEDNTLKINDISDDTTSVESTAQHDNPSFNEQISANQTQIAKTSDTMKEPVSLTLNPETTQNQSAPVMQTITPTSPTFTPPTQQTSQRKITSELQFFHWRVFFSRMYQRLNIEHLETGERWSLHIPTGQIQSDYHFVIQDNHYYLTGIALMIAVSNTQILIYHLEHGISLTIHLSND